MNDTVISEPILRRITDLANKCVEDQDEPWHLDTIRGWLLTERGYRETLAALSNPETLSFERRTLLERKRKDFEISIGDIDKRIYSPRKESSIQRDGTTSELREKVAHMSTIALPESTFHQIASYAAMSNSKEVRDNPEEAAFYLKRIFEELTYDSSSDDEADRQAKEIVARFKALQTMKYHQEKMDDLKRRHAEVMKEVQRDAEVRRFYETANHKEEK